MLVAAIPQPAAIICLNNFKCQLGRLDRVPFVHDRLSAFVLTAPGWFGCGLTAISRVA